MPSDVNNNLIRLPVDEKACEFYRWLCLVEELDAGIMINQDKTKDKNVQRAKSKYVPGRTVDIPHERDLRYYRPGETRAD